MSALCLFSWTEQFSDKYKERKQYFQIIAKQILTINLVLPLWDFCYIPVNFYQNLFIYKNIEIWKSLKLRKYSFSTYFSWSSYCKLQVITLYKEDCIHYINTVELLS